MSAILPRSGYIGRFAPSPTGPLHAGSLVAALASWLDARAHGGTWLVRIEDIDPPRCQPGADLEILRQLAACGLHPDGPVVWQSQRHARYASALEELVQAQLAYPCGCTRKDIEAAWQAMGLAHERHVERPYPGTCRDGLHGKPARAWRFALQHWMTEHQPNRPPMLDASAQTAIKTKKPAPGLVRWQDRRLGGQQQDVPAAVGDFVLRRADGLWAYQLAVVVDDGAQGVTDIVRGEDLADNTPRQLLLQQALALPRPRYLHTPLVRMANGEKLSKQHGAPAADLADPLAALTQAATCLGLAAPPDPAATLPDALAFWVGHWSETYPMGPTPAPA
jgi:glutamyl-Q tRNA(Asp) synthetase